MSYSESLEAAGATVLAYQSFGSYQGDWIALVNFEGKNGFVKGCYGSCSGCDAFEAEFGYYAQGCDDHLYTLTETCQECRDAMESHNRRLADFGKDYLDGLYSYDEIVESVSRNLEWDMDAGTMLQWVEGQKAAYDA